MNSTSTEREETIGEEIASALTHGLGAAAALAGGAVLITLAALYGDRWQLSAAIVFGITLLLLYVASTRAREQLLLTGLEPGTEFLQDMEP